MNRVILCILGKWKIYKTFPEFFGFYFIFSAGHLASSLSAYLGSNFLSFRGKKKKKQTQNSIILMLSFSRWISPGILPHRRWALPEPLIFLCWQNTAVFCPDSSALGSLCKRSFQSSSFLPSALPEISAGGEHCSVDVALLDSSSELSEVLLNLQLGFICK